MPDLTLNDVQRQPFESDLDGMRVPQLMRREAPPDTGLGGQAP